jgi:hypothetical protein
MLPTTAAGIAGHQLPQFHIKLIVLLQLPFVMAVATQGIAFVLLLEGALLEGQYVGHMLVSSPVLSSLRRMFRGLGRNYLNYFFRIYINHLYGYLQATNVVSLCWQCLEIIHQVPPGLPFVDKIAGPSAQHHAPGLLRIK